MFEIRVEPERERVRVRPLGELDMATTPRLRRAIQELLAAGFDDLVVDLHSLSFIDLRGIRLLLSLAREARGDGWKLSVVVGTASQVERLLELSGAMGKLAIEDLNAVPAADPVRVRASGVLEHSRGRHNTRTSRH